MTELRILTSSSAMAPTAILYTGYNLYRSETIRIYMDSIFNHSAKVAYPHCKKRSGGFPVPSWDVTNQTLLDGDGKTASLFLQCTYYYERPLFSHLLRHDQASKDCTAKKLYRKFETNIPINETARPRSQFLHSCFGERFIYSHEWSAYSAVGK
jgi:hypothetical protein